MENAWKRSPKMKILLLLLLTVSPILSAPVKDSDDAGYVKKPDQGFHSHSDAGRQSKWNFNYAPGDIEVGTVTGGDFKIGHDLNADITEESSSQGSSSQLPAPELKECEYTYHEVPSDCICKDKLYADRIEVCAANQVCTSNAGCFNVCKPDSKLVGGETKKVSLTEYENTCFCKNEDTGDMSTKTCGVGNMCTSDGECHFAYEVSGVSTNAISARRDQLLWTDALFRIEEMPEELINSIMFRPEELVGESTMLLSSPNNAIVYLALDENNNGGLLTQLDEQGWKKNDGQDGEEEWKVEFQIHDEPQTRGVLKIWSKEILLNQPIELKTNEAGAKFVIFFSTGCENEDVNGICFCKRTDNSKVGRHCLTGQGCVEGFCHDNLPKFGRK